MRLRAMTIWASGKGREVIEMGYPSLAFDKLNGAQCGGSAIVLPDTDD